MRSLFYSNYSMIVTNSVCYMNWSSFSVPLEIAKLIQYVNCKRKLVLSMVN